MSGQCSPLERASRWLYAGTCSLVLTIGSPVSRGDEAPLEEVLVTGSRIARPEFDSASPVQVITSEDFDETAATSVEPTLNAFPQFAPTATAASVDPGSDGMATLSLRGLGPTRTLVLLDGKRLMPADGYGQVDVNALPPDLIKSVEVLTGGASAVYGSDAIAGVVNFRLMQEFTGVQLHGQWSQTGYGDGQEYSFGLTAGSDFAGGRGAVMGYLGYAERDELRQDERRFSRVPLEYYPDEANGVGPGNRFLATGSGVIEEGHAIVFADPLVFNRLFETYGYAPGTVPYQPSFALNEDGTVFTTGGTAAVGGGFEVPGGVVNFRGEPDPDLSYERVYGYNTAPETALLLPLERTTAYASATFEFDESAEIYAQLLFADYTVTRRLSPTPVGIALVPVTNPYVTPDLRLLLESRLNPTAPFRHFKRATAVGPRVADNDRQWLQGIAGLRGRLGRWTYDAYVQAGRNERDERESGVVLLSRYQDLTFAADGGQAICGGLNPFSKAPIPAACADYISTDAGNEVTVDQFIGEASIEGDLLEMPAGALGVAAGVFFKRDEFSYRADPILREYLPAVPGVIGPRPDVAGFPAGVNRSGSESNTDLYLEAVVPLLRDKPGVESLELGLGYRLSEYQRAGSADAWKADLVYRPVEPLRLRTSFQHAVRAPSVEELYYPELSNQFVIVPPDPCSVSSSQRKGPDAAQVEALCLAQGMSPELLATFQFPLARVEGVSGGNPDLKPEQADTTTLGFVVASPFEHPALRALQLSLDWYRIELDDAVGRWDAQSAVSRCFDPAYNPDYDPGNVYCSFFERSSQSGEIFVRLIDRNIGGLDTSGVDFMLAWGMGVGPGAVSIEATVSHVLSWKYLEPDGSGLQYEGTIGGTALGSAVPEWKSRLELRYEQGPASLYTRWRYIDSMRDVRFPEFDVPARDYFDVGGSWSFKEGALAGLVCRAGIENALDEDPPVFPSYQQANTEPSLYDVLGRRYSLSAAWRF